MRVEERRVAAGAAYLAAAQTVGLAAGYGINIWVSRFLGPSSYGVYSIVFNTVSLVILVMSSGLPPALSRYIAADSAGAEALRRATGRLQLVMGIGVASLYFIAAPITARLLNDRDMLPYLRISAPAIAAYALYAVEVNYLNGLQLFRRQAILMSAYSVAKVVSIALLATVAQVSGAVAAIALAPLGAFAFGRVLARPRAGVQVESSQRTSLAVLARFALPFASFAVAMQLLTTFDLFLVKSLLGDNTETGFYAAASTLARVFYLLIGSVGLVLLPAVSTAASRASPEATRRLIQQAFRYVLLLLLPGVVLAATSAEALISFIFSAAYADSAVPFSILVVGIALFSLFYVMSYALGGAGQPAVPMGISFVALAIGAILGLALIPRYGLLGAAATSTTAALAATAFASYALYRRFQTFVPAQSLARMVIVSAALAVIASRVPYTSALLPLQYALLGGLYLLGLWLVRELRGEDVRRLMQLVRPDPRAG